MTDIDKQIESIGYKIQDINLKNGYIIYENKELDCEVTIQWNNDDQDCLIYSNTMSQQKDWYGNLYKEPIGLTISEIKIFMSKIEELRLIES